MNRDPKGTPQLPPKPSTNSSSNTLADSAKKSPSALGDPVSLKNESSDSSPTEHDNGARSSQGQNQSGSRDHESLSQKALKNPSALGDPVSLKAEQSSLIPTEEEKGAPRRKERASKL